VTDGETIRVTDRGVPVAVMMAAEGSDPLTAERRSAG